MDGCVFRFPFGEQGIPPAEETRGRSSAINSQKSPPSSSHSRCRHPSITVPVADGMIRSLSATNLELMAPNTNTQNHGAGSMSLSPPSRPYQSRISFAPSIIIENDLHGIDEAISPTTPLRRPMLRHARHTRSAVNLSVPRDEPSLSEVRNARLRNRQNAMHGRDQSRGRPQHRQQRGTRPPITYRGVRHNMPQSHSPGFRRPASQPADVHRVPRHTLAPPPRGSIQADRDVGSTTRFDAYVDRSSLCADRPTYRAHSRQRVESEWSPQFADQLLGDHLAQVSSASTRPSSRPRPPHHTFSSHHTFSGLSSASCLQMQQTLSPTQHRQQSSDRRISISTAVSRNRKQALESLEQCRCSIDPDNTGHLDQELGGLQSILSQTTETCVPLNPAAAALAEQEDKRDGTKWRQELFDPTGDCSICMTGICCPCVLVGRTAHRLKMKSAHQDAKHIYGMRKCNAQCTAYVILCGCQGITAAYQSNKTRQAYGIDGNWFKDILKGLLCLPCTIIQSEKEIISRETIAQFKGTSSQPGLIEPMTYPARLG